MLAIGTLLGPYQIRSRIGAGGMGEVYKAHDVRLDRPVAVKILSRKVSEKPALQARFVREAHAIAKLNHSHICTLYDVGNHEGVDYLVMEYLEGPTIEQRLEKGALPLREVFTIAVQIADALEKAHSEGMVHRDLKPGNIMLTASGAKLLDFGLAKLMENIQRDKSSQQSTVIGPTLTEEGTILGTLHYMAPEQLEGKSVDKRADIWAFGCLLFEMLTGQRTFSGDSRASVIAAVLTATPPQMSSIKVDVPPPLDRVVQKCLAKKPEHRWQSAYDLMDELRWLSESPVFGANALQIGRTKTRYAVIAISLSLALGAVLGSVAFRREATPRALVFSVPPPKTVFSAPPAGPEIALSPDGTMLAFVATDGERKLWVRDFAQVESRPIDGTDDAHNPFWSPDSKFIGFWAHRKLMKIPVSGGSPAAITDVPDIVKAAWRADDSIVFSTGRFDVPGIYRVPSTSGKPELVLRDKCDDTPQFIPNTQLFLCPMDTSKPDELGLWVRSLDSSVRKRLTNLKIRATYASPGYVMTVQEGKLLAQRFEVNRLELTGEIHILADRIAQSGGAASITASDNGVLAYGAGSPSATKLEWFDRTGYPQGAISGQEHFRQFRLSPDGRRAILDRQDRGNSDIWLLDLTNNIPSAFTHEPWPDVDPVWSGDGRQVAFSSNRNGRWQILVKSVGGAGETVVSEAGAAKAKDWSKDGKFLVYNSEEQPGTFALPLIGSDRKPIPIAKGLMDEFMISPDGKWVAYNSSESGRSEVFVSRFPSMQDKQQVSNGGGGMARWLKSGAELFYMRQDGTIMSVPIRIGENLVAGAPLALFDTGIEPNLGLDLYDVTPDGQRFLVVRPIELASRPIAVMVNWTARLP